MKSIILGCGRVGAGLAQSLCQRRQCGNRRRPGGDAFERLGQGSRGRPSLGPVWTVVLLQAGIEHADGLAAVTGSDDTNVVLARLAARSSGAAGGGTAPRSTPREVYRQLGIQTITLTHLGIQRLSELLCYTPSTRR